jgi:hypothetical protein
VPEIPVVIAGKPEGLEPVRSGYRIGMTRPGDKQDDRSHGESYPGPAAPDAEDEGDRYGLKRTLSEPGEGNADTPQPDPPDRPQR